MVAAVHLFALASQHAHWASVRQTVIAGNIANASTPAYTTREVQPFSAVMNETALQMAATSPLHLRAGDGAAGSREWSVEETGKVVALDQEMVKSNEVNRAFALDTSLMRSFHNMLLSSVRTTS